MILQICNRLHNVGDLLAPIITELITGEKVIKVFKETPKNYEGERILAGLGSFLGYYGDKPISVWGTGFEPGYLNREARTYPGDRSDWKYYMVRGNLTKIVLGLGDKVIIGDAALVMPKLYNSKVSHLIEKRYFKHFSNNITPPNLESFCVHTTKMNPFKAIDLITSSSFVFTEALHIAILAYAYDIPWAWSLNKHKRAMFKWFDWFSSLDLAAKWFHPTDFVSAENWFLNNYKHMKKININHIYSAFPDEFL